MQQSSSKLTDKSSAKESRRKIIRYLRDELKLSFSEVRQIWRIKDFIPYFTLSQYPDIDLDFRGAK
jgi:hypothetical protein